MEEGKQQKYSWVQSKITYKFLSKTLFYNVSKYVIRTTCNMPFYSIEIKMDNLKWNTKVFVIY